MLKVITKQGNNWTDSGILIESSSPDIKKTIYKNSNEQVDFIPPLVYVVKVKEREVFIESILNVLRPLVKFLKDTRYVEGLYNDVSKYFLELSKDQFDNCVELVTKESGNKDTEESIINIIEQYEEEFPPESITREEEGEEDEEEDIEDQEEATVSILRFKCSFGKVIESPDLQVLYDELNLNKEFMISKTLYGNEPEYIKTGLTAGQEKAIDDFVYSEHSSIKKEKILVKGVLNLLYYDLKYTILVKIADTGFVSLKIEPKKLLITSVDKTIEGLKKKIQKIYTDLVKKNIEDIEFNSFEIKIQYPKRLGYYTKELVSNIEKSEIKNGKVEYLIGNFTAWFSSKDEKLNFTIKGIKDIESIEKVKESVEMRVNYYLNNVGAFSTKQIEGSTEVSISTQIPHGLKNAKKIRIFNSTSDGIFDITSASTTRLLFDPKKKIAGGNYIFMGNVKKTSLKNLREAGLVVDSKECQKSRRPELLLKGDPSTGDDILELNGRKFRCNSPYTYHGIINNVNCCYKKKAKDIVKQKKAPVKRFDKAVKGYKKTLEGSLSHYLEDDYFLYTVQDLNEDRTIMECLEYLFDDTVDDIINNVEENVFLQNFKDVDFDTWKNTQEKSIYDIIKVISLHTKTSIFIFLDNLNSGLQVECMDIPYYEKYAIIYRSTEKTPAFYPVIKGDVKIHDEKDIQELLDVSKNSCNKGFYESIYNYTSISVSQVLDYQNLTVFVGIRTGGYVPVTPSTPIQGLEKISINSLDFRLLYPKSQYDSLMSIKQSHPELNPVGVTKILDSNIVTGIKLENGGIVPVSHQEWNDSPLVTVEDLFYIEKYSSPEEDFTSVDAKFLENLEKVKNLDGIFPYVKEENYTNLKEVISPITSDLDEITRIIWFLINNQED